VVVTGASSGLGAAAALELARRGLTVACISRSGALPASDVDMTELLPYACDVTDPNAIRQTCADFAVRADGIRALVNNAGRFEEGLAEDLDLAALRALMELNFVSALSAAQAVFPYLKANGGLIVATGSFFDRVGVRRALAYSASKAALASMGRTLAVEWARHGISVVTVAPGFILTDLNRKAFADPAYLRDVERKIPLRRLGQADEVARLIAAIIVEDIQFLTGATIYLDGGQGVSQ
jgi:NAD(P)-dependent dehydrogenase (short-subunit alcohol dehydrogenase family)